MKVAARTILRIEIWHGLLLFVLWVVLSPTKLIEPGALWLGGLFMGLNFFLLGLGVSLAVTPLAGRGRVKTGVFLLVLKTLVFLALLATLFFRFNFDGISFAIGFSSLLVAIFIEILLGREKLEA